MIDLNSFANGEVAERVNDELYKVYENIADINTDPKKPRKITITLTLSSDKRREVLNCKVQAKSTLAPTEEVESQIVIKRDSDGITGQEIRSGLKGQMFISHDGEILNDVGEAT
ncbi:TPA: replication terminator protein [Bacillus luti]|nr:replication terminator protein [Bacillus luti]